MTIDVAKNRDVFPCIFGQIQSILGQFYGIMSQIQASFVQLQRYQESTPNHKKSAYFTSTTNYGLIQCVFKAISNPETSKKLWIKSSGEYKDQTITSILAKGKINLRLQTFTRKYLKK